ncbi:MAG: Ribulose-phosphate 3-epimerase [Bacteroidia bacterium]|nr:Ribulose-phosphate 3-epimerase [Bacteroidia bacterium]
MALIAPSILSADFSKLREEVEMINRSEADWFHVDVMDGVFVPNISFGFPVIKQVKKYATKPLDVHLMIVQPERYVQEFKDAGADILTVHIEASTHLHRTLQQIKAAGMQAGVAVNPHTAINQMEDIITDVDLVCLMSVNPGFGGQKFIPGTFEKLAKLRKLIDSSGSKARIEIDGGVGSTNAAQLINTGADVLVAGNFVFSAEDPVGTIAALKKL